MTGWTTRRAGAPAKCAISTGHPDVVISQGPTQASMAERVGFGLGVLRGDRAPPLHLVYLGRGEPAR